MKKKWMDRLAELWPAVKGSLAKVYKPCIRPGCPACACGDKHPAWLLAYTQGGRRRCMYVPLEMVTSLRQAIKNGRCLEQMLYQTGPAMIKAYRRSRKELVKSPSKKRAKS